VGYQESGSPRFLWTICNTPALPPLSTDHATFSLNQKAIKLIEYSIEWFELTPILNAPIRPLWCGLLLCLPMQAKAESTVDPADQVLKQQQRERVLREQQEPEPNVHLDPPPPLSHERRLPSQETPCFKIERIQLIGPHAEAFQWTLAAANPTEDPALGRCLGSAGINLVMTRVQNALIAQGYTTSRVLAGPQNLQTKTLVLTLSPGVVRTIRFAPGSSDTNLESALPLSVGDLLNLRQIEQGLENLKRVPSADANIQITPSDSQDAQPGDSDLIVSRQQAKYWRFTLGLDDSGSQATGKMIGSLTLSLDNLARLNDLFYFSHNQNLGSSMPGERGAQGYTVHYSFPLKNWLLSYTRSGFDYHQQVAGSVLTYVYSGTSQNDEIRLSRLLARSALFKRNAWVSTWSNASRNAINGTEIGVQRRRMAGWSAGLGQLSFIGASTLNLQLGYRHGTGAHNAIPAPEQASGTGTARLGVINSMVQWSVPFSLGRQPWRYDLLWRTQWNLTPLTPQDRLAIAGRYSVRGFDGKNTLSAERGQVWQNTLSLPLSKRGAELFLGLDYGAVDGYSSQFLLGRHLAGAVLGLRGSVQKLNYELFSGLPLSRPDGFRSARHVTGFNLILTL